MDVGMWTAGASRGDSDVCGTVVRMGAGRECLHRQPCLVPVLLGSWCAMFVQRIGIAVVSRVRLFGFSNRWMACGCEGGSDSRVARFESIVERGSGIVIRGLLA